MLILAYLSSDVVLALNRSKLCGSLYLRLVSCVLKPLLGFIWFITQLVIETATGQGLAASLPFIYFVLFLLACLFS